MTTTELYPFQVESAGALSSTTQAGPIPPVARKLPRWTSLDQGSKVCLTTVQCALGNTEEA